MKTIRKEGLKLTTVLTTHHHADHAGGNDKLLELMGAGKGQIQVVGGDPSLQGLTQPVNDNEKLQVDRRWNFLSIIRLLQLELDRRIKSNLPVNAVPHRWPYLLSR